MPASAFTLEPSDLEDLQSQLVARGLPKAMLASVRELGEDSALDNVSQFERRCTDMLAAKAGKGSDRLHCWLHGLIGAARLVREDLSASHDAAVRALELAAASQHELDELRCVALVASVQHAMGLVEDAELSRARVVELSARIDSPIPGARIATRVAIDLVESGKLADALGLIEYASRVTEFTLDYGCLGGLTYARASHAVALGELPRASALIQRGLAWAGQRHSVRWTAEFELLLARASSHDGDHGTALASANRAWSMFSAMSLSARARAANILATGAASALGQFAAMRDAAERAVEAGKSMHETLLGCRQALVAIQRQQRVQQAKLEACRADLLRLTLRAIESSVNAASARPRWHAQPLRGWQQLEINEAISRLGDCIARRKDAMTVFRIRWPRDQRPDHGELDMLCRDIRDKFPGVDNMLLLDSRTILGTAHRVGHTQAGALAEQITAAIQHYRERDTVPALNRVVVPMFTQASRASGADDHPGAESRILVTLVVLARSTHTDVEDVMARMAAPRRNYMTSSDNAIALRIIRLRAP